MQKSARIRGATIAVMAVVATAAYMVVALAGHNAVTQYGPLHDPDGTTQQYGPLHDPDGATNVS